METQADCLNSITSKYENDKRHWTTTIASLQEKIEVAWCFLMDYCIKASLHTWNLLNYLYADNEKGTISAIPGSTRMCGINS